MICAFCGYDSGVVATVQDGVDKMANHIVECEKHPLHNAARLLLAKDAEIKKLVAALRKIAKCEGAFDRDPLTHAGNCIGDMSGIADTALAAYDKKGEDDESS